MNFDKILNKYNLVIICIKMNKHRSSTKILIIYHHLIYWKLNLIYTKIEVSCIENMHYYQFISKFCLILLQNLILLFDYIKK
jgi:hypothetical protein